MTTPAMHRGTLALHSAALALPPLARRNAAIAATGGAMMITGALLPWMTFYAGLQTVAGTRGAYGKVFLVAGVLMCLLAIVRWRGDVRWARRTHLVVGVLGTLVAAQLYSRAWRLAHTESALMLVPHPGIGLPIAMLGALFLVASVWMPRRR